MGRQRFIGAYTWFVVVSGLSAIVFSASRLQPAQLDARFILLAIITVGASPHLTTRIPRLSSHITVSDTFVFLTMLLFGGEASILLSAVEGFCSSLRVNKKVSTTAFNTAVMALSTFLTVWTLRLMFGRVADLPHGGYAAPLVVGLCVMALAQYAFNSGLVAILASLRINQSLWHTWKKHYLWASITYFAGASAAGIISVLVGALGFYAVVVTAPIIMIILFTYRTYLNSVEVSQAKADQAERHGEELSRHFAEQQRMSRALQESERQFRSAFEHAAGMAVVGTSGRWLKVNRALCRMLGYPEAELLGMSFQAVTHQDDVANDLTYLYDLMQNDESALQMEKRYVHKSGAEVWVLQSASLVRDSQNRPLQLIFQIQDITGRRRTEEALRTSETELRALFSAMTDVILVLSAEGQYLKVAPTNPTLLYKPSPELIGKTLHEIFPMAQADYFLRQIQTSIESNQPQNFEYSLHIGDKIVCFEASISPTQNSTVFWVARDITERKLAEDRIQHAATHDELTGLPNRALLLDRLSMAIERARRSSDYRFAVLFLDLDRFKVINDSLGHLMGDQLLVELSRRLEQCLRKVDTVARLGGDEFAVLLDWIEDQDVPVRAAGRIQQAMAQPFNLGGHEISTTVSIGIALSSNSYELPEEILRDADTAMYRAKSNGKAHYEVFNVLMHARAVELLNLETDLRRALERGDIRVHYQPVVALPTKQIVGFEALARWRHPERGFIPPAQFIPLAEETGLIVQLDMLVLSEAWRQMAAWQRQFPSALPLSMSVNLSAKLFGRPDAVERITYILKGVDLSPAHLCCEITESVLMENTENAIDMLKRLKSLGARVSIDDFGTGYSSLSYLHRFPIDILKIDRSFVSGMGTDKESSEIVGTILALASKLEMDVIAEGVETEGQLTQLEASGCEFGQGYFFSEPRDARTIGALLEMNFPTRPDAFSPSPHFFQEDETLSSDLSM